MHKDAAGAVRVPELDGFRGMAVLLVVVLHYIVHHVASEPGSAAAYVQRYLWFLWIGVDAFFVLSGFLIGGILLEQRESRTLFSVFYARRVLRIVPAYALLLLAWIVARRWAELPGMAWLFEPQLPAWSYALFVQNFQMAAAGTTAANFVAATWSLAVEEQFYLLLPLVIRFSDPRVLPAILCIAIASAPVLRTVFSVVSPDNMQWQTVLLPSRWDSLLVGVMLAWVVRQPHWMAALAARAGRVRAAFCALATLMLAWPVLLYSKHVSMGLVAAFFCHLTIAFFFGAVILVVRLGLMAPLARVLRARALRAMGRVSYFVYLFHTAVLGLVFALTAGKPPVLETPSDWARMGLAFVITLALAEASWRWLESPLLALGHRLRFAPSSSLPRPVRTGAAA